MMNYLTKEEIQEKLKLSEIQVAALFNVSGFPYVKIGRQAQDIKHWQVNTLLTLSSLENEQYCPVLLDVSELMELVPQVVTGRKLRYKAKTNFRTKARKNAECFCKNDDKKLAEILSKVV